MLKEDKGQPESWPTTSRISSATANCNITPLCLESLHWFFLIPPSYNNFTTPLLTPKFPKFLQDLEHNTDITLGNRKSMCSSTVYLQSTHKQKKKKKGDPVTPWHDFSLVAWKFYSWNWLPLFLAWTNSPSEEHPTYPPHGNAWPRLADLGVLLTPILITLGSKDFICEKSFLEGGGRMPSLALCLYRQALLVMRSKCLVSKNLPYTKSQGKKGAQHSYENIF